MAVRIATAAKARLGIATSAHRYLPASALTTTTVAKLNPASTGDATPPTDSAYFSASLTTDF